MFTIKHISEHGDCLMQSEGVSYRPAPVPHPIGSSGHPSSGSIWLDDQKYRKDGAPHIIDSGTVYIMNEMGKTVSRYDLSGYGLTPPEPPRNP